MVLKATPIALNLNKQYIQPTDEALVRAIVQNNDAQLFETLYDRHYEFVYKRCLSFLRTNKMLKMSRRKFFPSYFLSYIRFLSNQNFLLGSIVLLEIIVLTTFEQ